MDDHSDDQLIHLERQLRIEQLRSQIARHRSTRFRERLPDIAMTFILFCAGSAATLIFVVAAAVTLRRLAT